MQYVEKLSAYFDLALDHVRELSIATIVIALTVAAFFLFALRYGKDRIVALTLSLYVGLFIFLNFPYAEKLTFWKETDLQILISNAVIYIAWVLIVYVIIEKVIWTEYPNSARRYLEAFALSLAASALLLSFAYHILPIASFYALDPTIELLFSSSRFFFWWLILPLVGILLFARR